MEDKVTRDEHITHAAAALRYAAHILAHHPEDREMADVALFAAAKDIERAREHLKGEA